MLRPIIIAALFLLACGGMKPIAVTPPSWDGLMAGQTVYARLQHDQAEIRAAHKSRNRAVAYQALKATESAWESYSSQPTVDHWNNLQTVGSNLDAALRKMRGQQVGAPGQMPPCVTMKESWCRQPRLSIGTQPMN
jgi:hypothetical protein